MNYKGRINSEYNLVNKGYVDNAVATAQPAGSYVKTPTADSSADDVFLLKSTVVALAITLVVLHNGIIHQHSWQRI